MLCPRARVSLRRSLWVAIASVSVLAGESRAADRLWDNPSGGNFNVAPNWFGGIPGVNDVARFGITDSSFVQRSYTVFITTSPTNQQFVVEDDNVLFSMSGASYTLTNTFVGVALGTVPGRSGNLRILGGTVSLQPTADLEISPVADGKGELIVDAGGRVLGSDVLAGLNGEGTLRVINNGDIFANSAVIGKNSGSVGTATISGAGSGLGATSSVIVGDLGEGTLNIDLGGTVNDIDGFIGNGVAGAGTVNVNGSGSRWINSGQVIVGAFGSGTLEIKNGGEVQSFNPSAVGQELGSTGVVRVFSASGIASRWIHDDTLLIGEIGYGRMEITGGGLVQTNGVLIGKFASGEGTVTVSDATSLFDNRGPLTIGDEGFNATMEVTLGGDVRSTNGTIGSGSGDGARVSVNGRDSKWINSGSLAISRGSLEITNGGFVQNVDGFVSRSGNAAVTVSGPMSRWLNTGNLTVSDNARAKLFIIDGGSVESVNTTLGSFGDSVVLVDGANSRLSCSGALQVSTVNGFAILRITNGAIVEDKDAEIGADFQGVVTVEGLNAQWINTRSLTVSNGTLTIHAGASVIVGESLLVDFSSDGTGTAVVNLNGGLLSVGPDPRLFTALNFNAGTFRITGDQVLDAFTLDPILGAAHTIRALQHLDIVGRPTLEELLVIDGGTFSAGSLLVGSPILFNSGTFNLTSDNLVIGPAGLFGDTLALSNRNVNVTNTATIQSGARLQLQGGTFSAGTLINQGTIDFQNQSSQVCGGLLTNTGTIRGTGTILNNIQNNTAGQIQTTAGQRLEFGGTVNNGGLISLVGGQMQFNAAVTNSASTGAITARDAILRFGGGLINAGSLAATFGTTDVFGDIANSATGRIVVSGGAQATFYDDVTNAGSINVSVSGSLQSTAVFFGSLSGNGISGGGRVFNEGDLRPGFSPGTMVFGGDLSFGPLASLEIEIGGTMPGAEFDRVTVADSVFIDGTLDVTTINGFSPTLPGQSFTILTSGSLAGTFSGITGAPSVLLPGLFWKMTYTPTSAILSTSALPGDIDLDGDVDRTDAARLSQFFGRESESIWTTGDFDNDGRTTLADWAALQTHLGQALPRLSPVAVPEPSTLLLMFSAAVSLHVVRRIKSHSRPT